MCEGGIGVVDMVGCGFIPSLVLVLPCLLYLKLLILPPSAGFKYSAPQVGLLDCDSDSSLWSGRLQYQHPTDEAALSHLGWRIGICIVLRIASLVGQC